ncbi:nuclear transport factor 2 isoform X1 [Vitis vinifera]|nr:nuclear transport factor 2 isoform X1 [Vitis vinifera]XP_010660606.1 nuclear transport factor 2 isoform X1 [Vitis vinifera]|eukprot:XP_010660605.1 PREDICTED: ras GTPase-activating protein-binding protein 1 isoform X1 [Vitis vinifera]
MAMQTENPQLPPSAEVVGNAFVEQYYYVLHRSPELVFRFYRDSSVMSWPDSNGLMSSVTTMQGINEKILSSEFKNRKTEIMTTDSQSSYEGGVIVLVTGCLMTKDKRRKKFTQSFFLAPQYNGYYVLNDVLRYIVDGEALETIPINGTNDSPAVSLNQGPGHTHDPDPPVPDPATSVVEDDEIVIEKVYDPLENEEQLVNEEEDFTETQSHPIENDDSTIAESSSSSAQEDAPKKSYASIVKVMKGSSGSTKVYVPTKTTKVTPAKTENQSPGLAAPAPVPESSVTSSINAPESSDAPEEVEGHSIYIRNLPLNVTVSQLEAEFQKFGPIKQGGVQVRSNKQQAYCFGFVEFLSLSSMHSAIQASPIIIGDHQAVVEIKRTTTRVGSGRGGRFPSGRGVFRGRGSFGGGRGFVRIEYGIRGEFSGRGRGPSGRSGGEGYRQGRGRAGRPSGHTQNAGSR